MNGEVHLIPEINMIIVFFISGLVLKTGSGSAMWKPDPLAPAFLPHAHCCLRTLLIHGRVPTTPATPAMPCAPFFPAAADDIKAALRHKLGVAYGLIRCGRWAGRAQRGPPVA